MKLKQKRERLQNIIKRIEKIMESDDYMNAVVSEKDLKLIEVVLGIKPHSKKNSQQDEKREVKKISGRGLKYGRKKSCNKF